MDTFTCVLSDDEAGEEDEAFLSAIAKAEADGLRRLSQEGGDSKRKHEREQSHHAEPAESVSSSLQSSYGGGYADGGYGYGDKEAASKRSRAEPEGEYLAALRGTHSETWQAMTSKARPDAKQRYAATSSVSGSANLGFDGGGAQGGGSGACFHCGKEGHWAKDCPSKGTNPTSWGPDTTNIPGQAEVPEKNCPCGGGACKVLTANTEKNAGRQFYRCPLRKEEGQCGFFEWCDNSTGTSQGLSKERISSDTQPEFPCPCGTGPCVILTAKTEKNMGRQFYRCPLNQGEGSCGFFKWCDESLPAAGISAPVYGGYPFGDRASMSLKEEGQCGFNSSIGKSQGLSKDRISSQTQPEFPCPCGTGPCVILTAKTEKNMGRQFYRCPLNQGEGSCGFFKWCDENLPAAGASAPVYGGNPFGDRMPMSNVTTGQCYKCGMDGHWAKDCSSAVSNATPKGFASMLRTGQSSYGSKGAVGGFNRYGGETNFSLGVPNASGYGSPGSCRDVGAVGNSGSGGCFKCGAQGHWSKDCPSASNARPSSYGGQSQGAYVGSSLSGRSGGSGSCYKCGGQGHWASECRADGKGRNMY